MPSAIRPNKKPPLAMPENIDLSDFRRRHRADRIGIISAINRSKAAWACPSCGGIDRLVAWKQGRVIARDCLHCEGAQCKQLSLL
jgi:Zn ribbon nucleic-acid-binding protein